MRHTDFPVYCRCREPIEHCDGLLGDWMHSRTRRERCADGGVATPEYPIETAARQCKPAARRAS